MIYYDSMRNLHKHHHFFSHANMDALYLSVFVMNIAESMISIFVPIYLYSLGYSITWIILFFLISRIGGALFALPASKIAANRGPAWSIALSTPFLIVYYIGLLALPQWPGLFLVLPLVITGRALLYNFGFDIIFLFSSHEKRMGRELSTLSIVSIMASVISPFAAGVLIVTAGYTSLFGFGAVLLCASVIPLFVARFTHRAFLVDGGQVLHHIFASEYRPASLSFVGYAIENSIGFIVWPIFLVLILTNVSSVGAVVSLSTFVTLIVITLVGKMVDKNKTGMLRFGTVLYFFGWVGSIFANTPVFASLIDIYRRAAGHFVGIPWAALFYSRARKQDMYAAVVARHLVYNASRIVVLPFLALLFLYVPHPFAWAFAIAGAFSLLYSLLGRKA